MRRRTEQALLEMRTRSGKAVKRDEGEDAGLSKEEEGEINYTIPEHYANSRFVLRFRGA
jgi:hypothetical protein